MLTCLALKKYLREGLQQNVLPHIIGYEIDVSLFFWCATLLWRIDIHQHLILFLDILYNLYFTLHFTFTTYILSFIIFFFLTSISITFLKPILGLLKLRHEVYLKQFNDPKVYMIFRQKRSWISVTVRFSFWCAK